MKINKDNYGTWFPEDVESCEILCPDCGLHFVLTYGTPRHHEMYYCPKCGKLRLQPIKEQTK